MANAKPSSASNKPKVPTTVVDKETGKVKLPEDYILPQGVKPEDVKQDAQGRYFETKSKKGFKIRTNLL